MTFKIIVRGSPTPVVAAEYHCEEHGRFELDVARTSEGDAPDEVPCPVDDDCYGCGGQPSAPGSPHCTVCDGRAAPCGRRATWCISAPLTKVRAVEAIKGKWAKPEKKTYTDTRAIGEGQPLYDWKEDRAKVWEEQRKADVMKFAKGH